MIEYFWFEQGSPEWHKIRENLWTGSKAIRLLQGKPMPRDYSFDGNNATRRGHMLEVVALREYARQYKNARLERPGFVKNRVYSNAGYSPDALDCSWLLECKALNGVRHEDLFATGRDLKTMNDFIISKIPLQYLVQIFFGMIITGKRKARLLAINPENEEQLVVIEIGYDKLIGNNIRKKLREDMKRRLLQK